MLNPMKKLLLASALLLTVLSGCQTLYVPNPVNMPLMSEPGETQVAMQVSTNGYNGQLAFSPAYHVALMASGNTYSIRSGINLDTVYKAHFIEIGAGTYWRLSKFLRFEAYGGYGGGSEGLEFDRSVISRWFFQPNIGVSGRFVDAGFAPRFSFVNYLRDEVNRIPTDVGQKAAFFEPQFMARAGYEQFKFHFSFGPSIPLGYDFDGDYRKWNVAFGIHLTLVKDYEKYMR